MRRPPHTFTVDRADVEATVVELTARLHAAGEQIVRIRVDDPRAANPTIRVDGRKLEASGIEEHAGAAIDAVEAKA